MSGRAAGNRTVRGGTLRQWLGIGAWAAGGGLAVALSVQRYSGAMAQDQFDLHTFFLRAGVALARGVSPYTVDGYFYTPLVAVTLAPFAGTDWAQAAWTIAMIVAGASTAFFGTLACTRLWPWQCRGWVFLLAVGTLLWSWPSTFEFFMGQTDLFVTALVAVAAYLATRRAAFGSGLALGIAAAVKTWPALLVLWIFRRNAASRGRTIVGVGLVAVSMVALALPFGPGAVRDMILSPARGSQQPHLVAYSAWGLGTALFGEGRTVPSIGNIPAARTLTIAIALALLIALTVIVLRMPGDSVISLYNLTFITVLIMPVSHFLYLLLPLPALWWWLARLIEDPRSRLRWAAALALAVWWVLAFRLVPSTEPDTHLTLGAFVAVIGSTLVATIASVICAALLARRGQISDDQIRA